ncbi:MAG: hypothetical protein DDT40_01538 [candidate division WS2 bacterium]|nr:hypothetical protein [Candidatus Psychracetigena formicireducens]
MTHLQVCILSFTDQMELLTLPLLLCLEIQLEDIVSSTKQLLSLLEFTEQELLLLMGLMLLLWMAHSN